MWFRNLRLYRLPAGFKPDLTDFESRLARRPLTRCGSFDMVSRGWVYPRLEGAFVHAANRQWLLALGVEQKLLPMTVIRQTAQERAAAIAAEQGRKVGRKEMRDIAERVTEELLPKAFSQRRTTWGWLDPAHGWLAVDAGSDARADEFMEALLATLGDVALRPLQTQVSPLSAMTGWLAANDPPAGFSLDSDLELRAASASQAAIRYVHHDIGGPEIAGHLAAGKLVTRLGLTWNDKVSFVLTDKLHLKRLAFLDVLKEQAEKTAEGTDELFDADFALMAGELGQLFEDLLLALGGEQKPA
ncbi:MAG: recombination-associated protein RdgC [Sulfuritalea sp.]|nr:recombination-associated protein RdgC [Sulfuritalea sp.]